MAWVLRLTTALLLVGHGGFGAAMAKSAWVSYFGVVGVGRATVAAKDLIGRLGWFEIGLGLLVLVCPLASVVLFVCVWKLGVELLRPLAGESFFEVVERGGSYAAPLALFYVQRWRHAAARQAKMPGPPTAPRGSATDGATGAVSPTPASGA